MNKLGVIFMKRIISILIFSILASNFLFAQGQVVKDTVKRKIIFGYSVGIMSSQFYVFNNNNNNSLKLNTGKKLYPGISAGCFISLPSTNEHFLMQPEIDYNLIDYRIRDNFNSYEDHFGGYEETVENYSLYASFIQLSFIPTIKIGKRIKACIKIGPYLSVPIGNIISGYINKYGASTTIVSDTAVPGGFYVVNHYYNDTIKNSKIKVDLNPAGGLLIGIGMTFPCKGSIFGFYLKDCISPMNFGKDSNFQCKQNLVSLCLIYQMK